MRWNHVVALISLLLMSQLSVDAAEKTCRGKEVKELEDGCTIINEAPLIFRDLKDEALIKRKTETISIIEHGVEVIETNIESFDYLKNATKISNKEGPAIIFRKNQKLKRFNFDGLKYLKGDPVDVVLEDDHFSSEGSSSSQSFHDWMFLEHISRSTHQRTEKCSKQFLEVRTTKESSDEDFKLPAIIAMGVFALLCIVSLILIWNWFKHRRSVEKNDKKTTEKTDEKNKTKNSSEAGTKSLEKSKSPATEIPTKSKSAEPTGSK
ncbi:hypothetical protein GCK72_015139 [Caenorhabditis remanei]|uniref:Receptor L-domain domain-containing protein n=1 Tax=Caenorhabditis remanei TaxID=31234 RepID=A0A6A5GTB3_CAERE|nr:hypothetical protein GCK72_015139 [Caenorhabditis remanei]KAF1758680.1 hypothetical protein GCK72_015139 [Caenorhabditis remanei]